jgi:hypothetical protein
MDKNGKYSVRAAAQLSAGQLVQVTGYNAAGELVGNVAANAVGTRGTAVAIYGGASGTVVAVQDLRAPDQATMIASGAITAGAAVYGDTGGKITSTASSNPLIGRALEAAAADGDLLRVQPY